MSLSIGMQAIGVRAMKITCLRIVHWIKATNTIQINNRHSPYVTSLFQHLYIFIHINSYFIGISLLRLHIFSTKLCKTTMERSQHYNLLRREMCLQVIHQTIDTSTKRIRIHCRFTIAATTYFTIR